MIAAIPGVRGPSADGDGWLYTQGGSFADPSCVYLMGLLTHFPGLFGNGDEL